MGFFNTNYSEVGSFELVPEGEYEAVISDVKKTTSKNSGAPMLKVTYTIRTDVEQPAQKRKMFDNLVQMDSTIFKFQQLSKAVGIAEGLDIETLEDFAKLIKFKAVRIKVTHRLNDYNGKEEMQANVAFVGEPKEAYSGGDPNNGPMGNPFDDPDVAPPDDINEEAAPPPAAKKAAKKGKKTDEAPPWEKDQDDLPF